MIDPSSTPSEEHRNGIPIENAMRGSESWGLNTEGRPGIGQVAGRHRRCTLVSTVGTAVEFAIHDDNQRPVDARALTHEDLVHLVGWTERFVSEYVRFPDWQRYVSDMVDALASFAAHDPVAHDRVVDLRRSLNIALAQGTHA